jgi:general secretion pathway protein E/type IV pilus assembly protein PilB
LGFQGGLLGGGKSLPDKDMNRQDPTGAPEGSPPAGQAPVPPPYPQQVVPYKPEAGQVDFMGQEYVSSTSQEQAPAAPAQDAVAPQEPQAVPAAEAAAEPPSKRRASAKDVTSDSEPPKETGTGESKAQDNALVKKNSFSVTIGERLVNEGLISKDQLEIALKMQRENKEPGKAMLGSILVELGFITESALGEVLAESTGIEHFDPKTAVLDSNLIKQIPKNIALRHKVIPVMLEDNSVYLAMADIYNVLAIDQVQRHFPRNYKIVPLYCSEADILEMVDNYYDYDMSIEGILKEIEEGIADNSTKISGEIEGYTNPTVRLVDSILVDAIKRGSSDIHFEPEGAFLRLRYRIDGKMRQIRSFHKDYWSAISVRIKIISGMNIAENRHPQDGRITYNVLGREVDFRVSTQPTIHGENIVMRILDKKKALVTLENLGMSDHNVKLLKKLLMRPEGIIIVTGPTGSGKTTTLYSVLSYINSIDVNIMTLEDPVEYQMPMIRQSNIRAGGGLTFADGLKAIMRQDPDIIFVGEIRDQETASMALRAAMTGHQVYSTLHTNDALGALPRLIDIGLKPTLLAGAVICSVAQRLARRLCPQCREPYNATEEECRILGADTINPPVIYRHKGCDACTQSGYKGRVAVMEIVPVDRDLDELIATSSTRQAMMDHLKKKGFRSMQDDGIQKVLDGVTDLEELIDTLDMTERF